MTGGIIIAYFIGYLVGWLATRRKAAHIRKKIEALEEVKKYMENGPSGTPVPTGENEGGKRDE